jgi:transposase
MSTPAKRKALLASGTLNRHPDAVRSELFHMDFFDPYDFAQVKYEMLRAHSVDEDPVAEVCRQFGLSRESFYQIQQAFQELGFSSLLPRKRGRKGPIKLKDEVLEFALAQKKENPAIDPGHLAALVQERYGIAIHRTTVLRGLKKNCACRGKSRRDTFVARDDPVQRIYENVRCEALENSEPASWALERFRRYGVASLLPGGQQDFPFILYAQSVPPPAWNGKRDSHREKLLEVYEFLTREVNEDASCDLCPRFQREAGEGTYDRFAIRSLAELRGSEWDGDRRGVHG